MGRPYDHQYLDAAKVQCGEMRCGGCGQPITEGWFRAYKRSAAWDWRYVTHHRACCAGDPAWQGLDAKQGADTARLGQMLTEARAFRTRWNVDDLDELIAGLEDRIRPAADEEEPDGGLDDDERGDGAWIHDSDMGAR